MRGRNCWGPGAGRGNLAGASASHTSCLPGKGCSALPLHTFLSSPHSLLFSGDFYFTTSPPFFLHKRTLQFRSLSGKSYALTNRELIISTMNHLSPFLTKVSILQPWVLLLSRDPLLQPLLSHFWMLISWDCPFRDSHSQSFLSLPGLSFPQGPSSPLLGLSLLGPSSPFRDSHLRVPPAPSSPPLLGHSSWALTSVSSPVLSSHPSSLGAWLFETPAPVAPPV